MEHISIKEFTKEALIDICEGIQEAKEEIKKKWNNCPIAPANVEGNEVYQEQKISFDIAVTASSYQNTELNGQAKIYVVAASADKNSTVSKEFVSRVKFDVPFYPQAGKDTN